MDVDTCIREYVNMAREIFPIKDIISGSDVSKFLKASVGAASFDPGPLEDRIKYLVAACVKGKSTTGADTPFKFEATLDKKLPKRKVYVCIVVGLSSVRIAF
jgi:hypothetical protein